jgi:hypothetical protein
MTPEFKMPELSKEAYDKIAKANTVQAVFNEIKRYADIALPLVMARTNTNKTISANYVAIDAWQIGQAMYDEGHKIYKHVVSQVEKDQNERNG